MCFPVQIHFVEYIRLELSILISQNPGVTRNNHLGNISLVKWHMEVGFVRKYKFIVIPVTT